MFGYQIIWTPAFNYTKKYIDEIFKICSKTVDKKQNWILNIVFVDASRIKDLNKNYRKKDTPTDVLSFHYYDDFNTLKKDEIAWEIVLCEEIIKKQGQEYGLGTEKEFYKLLIHSILHILGHDHEEENEYKMMRNLEEKIWEEIFIKK